MCRLGAVRAEAFSLPWQVWESVPYLASYLSPVLKEGRSIPLLPRELQVAWNGKGGCALGSHGVKKPLQEDSKGLSLGCPCPGDLL